MRIETNRLIITEFTMDMAQAVHLLSLDEDNRRKALDTIRAYPKEAIVLLVTHSREDAEALGAEIIEI